MVLSKKLTLLTATLLSLLLLPTFITANSHSHVRVEKDKNQTNTSETTKTKKSEYEQKTNISLTIKFEPPPSNSEPTATATGASRKGCGSENISSNNSAPMLTALFPLDNQQWLTIKDHPNFFVFLPQTSASAMFFQLKDDQDQIISQNVFPLQAQQNQVVNIQITDNSPALQVERNYQLWVFLLCKYDPNEYTNNSQSFQESYDLINEPWIKIAIKKIDPPSSLGSKKDEIISLELAEEYAKNGLWLETLAILHQLLQEKPNNRKFIKAWQDLLESQEIDGQIINAELVSAEEANSRKTLTPYKNRTF